MDDESAAYQTGLREYGHDEVGGHGPPRMQRVETDTTTVRVIYRRGQQMVHIYDHGE